MLVILLAKLGSAIFSDIFILTTLFFILMTFSDIFPDVADIFRFRTLDNILPMPMFATLILCADLQVEDRGKV
jgi:hypothetical protein